MTSEQPAVLIRRMIATDLEAVEAIDKVSFPLPWPPGAYHRELTNNPNAQCWVAESAGKIAGMLVGWKVADEYQIATIATHPDYRRRGIGRKLLAAALRKAQQLGAESATLEVRESNLAAQSLYTEFGFRIVGERVQLYANGENAILMTLFNLKHFMLPGK